MISSHPEKLENRFSEETIELSACAYSIESTGDTFKLYVNGFNNYAKKNNIDVKVNLNLISNTNFTYSIDNYNEMVESLLKKKSNKYDIYFYDYSYSFKYCPYLLDLQNGIPKSHIDMYDKHILDLSCYCSGNKYHKDIPKTWNELISTGKEILEKEHLLNNTELIGYNGLIFDSEEGMNSIYEFIYSCRESYNSSFPDLTSNTAIEASKLLKKLKEEISSDMIFKSDYYYSVEKLFSGNAVFIKFYSFIIALLGDNSPYVLTKIPGKKEGLSGSILSGYNIGIDSSINKEKIDGAMKVIEFMTSKEFQKDLTSKQIIMSGILSLYEDEEICSSIKYCEYYKNFQGIMKPIKKTNNYNEYSKKFTNYFYEYLYGNETVLNTLKNIDDITKIYYVSIYSKENSIGLIALIILTIIFVLVVSSLLFLFLNKFKNAFNFLSKPL
eukprot:jgi/Orpsp1_1/1182028/evm.model.c7180000079572.2